MGKRGKKKDAGVVHREHSKWTVKEHEELNERYTYSFGAQAAIIVIFSAVLLLLFASIGCGS